MTGLVVMEDDAVLCANCVDELQAEQPCETAASTVHAWLADPDGQACSCCGGDGSD